MTCEEVDAISIDTQQRHFLFLHFVLGEPWVTALVMACELRDEPLTLDEMRYVADRWAA